MSIRRTLAGGLVLAAGISAAGCGGGHGDSPSATVRSFLTDAVVDHDGQGACTYLTRKARAELERERHAGCDDVFGNAVLPLGRIGTAGDVADLHYSETRAGRLRIVTVAGPAGRQVFTLRPANSVESAEFEAPDTGWRIDSDVAFLVPV